MRQKTLLLLTWWLLSVSCASCERGELASMGVRALTFEDAYRYFRVVTLLLLLRLPVTYKRYDCVVTLSPGHMAVLGAPGSTTDSRMCCS